MWVDDEHCLEGSFLVSNGSHDLSENSHASSVESIDRGLNRARHSAMLIPAAPGARDHLDSYC